MHRGSAEFKRAKRRRLLKEITDIIFYIIVAIIFAAFIALLAWNETELVNECKAEGHSTMYCIRILSK